MTAEGVTTTITGEVIVIMHQHACYGIYKTIHSSSQIEHYKDIVDKRSIKVSGGQTLSPWINIKLLFSFEGYHPTFHYVLTLIRNGVHPHVMFTSDIDYYPTYLDYEVKLNNEE